MVLELQHKQYKKGNIKQPNGSNVEGKIQAKIRNPTQNGKSQAEI